MNENATPYNLEAEQSILGCMLLDNEILPEVLDGLTESDFYVTTHKYVITAIKSVYADRQPVDIVTLSDKLEGEAKLKSVGGISYLTELMQVLPSAANYKYYFEIVKRDSRRRSLITTANEIIAAAQTTDDAEECVKLAESKIYGISEAIDSAAVVDIREIGFNDIIERLNELEKDKDAYRGVMTGFFRLDKITNGLQKSDLIVLAARPGCGKTSFAMNIVEHAAVYGGATCAVFSLEMSEIQIRKRLMYGISGVSMSAAQSGRLNFDDWKRIAAANLKILKSPIYIDESARTPSEILSKCRRIKSKNGGKLDLVVIDYIQLMSSGNKRDENRTLEVGSITRNLKLMAKELDVPVLALSQLNRQADPENPQLSDLRDSGAIEQDADIVMFINRPDMGLSDDDMAKKNIAKGTAILHVAKHRNGELGRLPLRFRGETTKFTDAEKEV